MITPLNQYAKFQASLKERGIKTGIGVKMALQEFVAENVSDADVARFEAARRHRDLAASGGSQSVGGGLSLRERVGSLGSLLQGSRRSLECVDDPPESLGDTNNASWNLQNAGSGLSRSFDPALFNSGIKKSDSFNYLIGDAFGKLGRAAVGATTAPPTDVVAGNPTVFELDNLPPRAAERKKRASFGSLGALSMQKNFIDELSSDNEEEEKPSGEPSTNPSNKKNDGSRSRGDSGDEESGEDDADKEYLGGELVVGFGSRPVRK